jgi:hypothetical protein
VRIGVGGCRSGSEETPDKQKWIRREFMPADKMAELVKKYDGMFVSLSLDYLHTLIMITHGAH